MWTSPAADPGAVIHVEQPEATTDGAAGTAGAVTDTSGRLATAPPAPVSHPVRPPTTMAVVTLVSRRIRFCLRALGVTLLRHILNHARPPWLQHDDGEATWILIEDAISWGIATRLGLEDTLFMPRWIARDVQRRPCARRL